MTRLLNIYQRRTAEEVKSVPKPGDIIFFRERRKKSKSPVTLIDGKHSKQHESRPGTGAIFAKAIVNGKGFEPRTGKHLVVDHGDVDNFRSVLVCSQHEFCDYIKAEELKAVLRRSAKDKLRFLDLWRIKDPRQAARLLSLFEDRIAGQVVPDPRKVIICFNTPEGTECCLKISGRPDHQKLTFRMCDQVLVIEGMLLANLREMIDEANTHDTLTLGRRRISVPPEFGQVFCNQYKKMHGIDL